MRWIEPNAAVVPLAAAVPTGAPWPIIMVLGLCGLLVYCWRLHLVHQERMRAIEKTPDSQIPDLMRSIQRGERQMRKGGTD